MDYRDTRVLTTVVTAYKEYGGATAYGLPSHQSTNNRRVTVYRSTVEPRLIDYHDTTVLISKNYCIIQIGSTVEPRLMDYRHTRVLTTVESRFIGARWSHGLLTTMTPLSSSQIIIVNREYGGATAYGLPSHQSTNHRRVTVYRSTVEPRLIDYHDTTVLISKNYCIIQIPHT